MFVENYYQFAKLLLNDAMLVILIFLTIYAKSRALKF